MLGFTRLHSKIKKSGPSAIPGTVTPLSSSLGWLINVTTLPVLCEAREQVATMAPPCNAKETSSWMAFAINFLLKVPRSQAGSFTEKKPYT